MDGQQLDTTALHAEARQLWEQKAGFWDERMGEGNAFHRVLIGPAVERLLGVVAGETVLDAGCGNGVLARQLATLGATVVAIDGSPTFLERARARSEAANLSIDYGLIDLTDEQQLSTLGRDRFDAVVSTMVLMDLPTIAPLLRAVARLLRPSGRFVFAVMHPCLNNGSPMGMEMDDAPDGSLRERYYVKIDRYLTVTPSKGTGIIGEPTPHWYFHRPLHELFGACFAAGLVLDGLEEPAFGPEHASSRQLTWGNLQQIPPVLVARFRVGSSPRVTSR